VPPSPDRLFLDFQAAVAGRYSLDRELGRGGMGIVFLARDVALDRPVAIKLLPPAMAAQPALRERFLREAQLAAKLSHPNIVPIFTVDAVGHFVFFVMAYVEGETLGHRLRTRGPLNPSDGTRMLQEVAWALAYAHLRGIVHRDIKPDNILLERTTGRALVADFGIARPADTSGSIAAGEVLGTAQYMSPEQATGEKLDGRSDLYALGVVAFYALSGRLPFDAAEVPALLAMQVTKAPPPLAAVAPGVPGKLAQAVDRCLAKDPGERFQTGEALAEAVAASTAVVREVPAPIRVWFRLSADVRAPLAVVAIIGGISVVASVAAGHGPGVGYLLVLFGPLAVYGFLRARLTRRVLAAGYSLDDIRLALRERAAQARDELAFEIGAEPTLFGRLVRWGTLSALATSVASVAAMVILPGGATVPLLQVWFWSSVATAAGAVVGRIFPGRRVRILDPAESLPSRLWNGKAGEWLARIVGWTLKRPALPAAGAQRPTEIAIGLAVGALFEALPRKTRKELKDVPAVVGRLETEAQALRARVDELDALLAGAGEDSPGARSPSLRQAAGQGGGVREARQRLREELSAERDRVSQRLATAVAALENIRLDLMRLTAGVSATGQITADLAAARQIGFEVDALLASSREVEALLGPPPHTVA
jgi:serine/threonine-protein kinase